MIARIPCLLLCGIAWQNAAARLDNCSIYSPQRNERYAPGDEFALAGGCSYDNGSPIDPADLIWKVEYHVDGKVQDTIPVTNEASGPFFKTKPQDAAGATWYRVWLTSPDTAIKFAIDVPPASGKAKDVYLSELAWSEIANGWGPVEKDGSNGETGLGDGGSISIRHNGFGKGFGIHAPSEISVPLEGACYSLVTSYGTDDEVDGGGSVAFRVQGDGKQLFQSPVVKGIERIRFAVLDVTGVKDLRLEVLDGGDGNEADHADWAGIRAICREGFGPTTSARPTLKDPARGDAWTVTAGRGGFEFRFGIGVPGNVSLELRDARGGLIARADQGRLAAGEHRIAWSPGAPGIRGIFFAVLRTEAGARARSMVGFKD